MGRANYLNSLAGEINIAAVVWESISHQEAFSAMIPIHKILQGDAHGRRR